MKKILLMVAAAAIAALGACSGNKESKAVEADENTVITKIQNCANPDSLTVYVDQAKAYAQKLVDEGKIDEAKAYLDKITPVVKEKAPALLGTLETVKTAISKVPGQVADSVSSSANAVADSIASKGAEIKDAYNSVKDAGAKGVEDAKQGLSKAKEDVKSAAGNAAGALNNALGK